MPTNLALDDKLIVEAQQLGNHPSKKAAVTAAIVAYIRHHKQQQLLEELGSFEYEEDYQYKMGRGRRAS